MAKFEKKDLPLTRYLIAYDFNSSNVNRGLYELLIFILSDKMKKMKKIVLRNGVKLSSSESIHSMLATYVAVKRVIYLVCPNCIKTL